MIKKADVALIFFLLAGFMFSADFIFSGVPDSPGGLLSQTLFMICIGIMPFAYSLARNIPFSEFAAPGVFSVKLAGASLLAMTGSAIFSLFLAMVSSFLLEDFASHSLVGLEEMIVSYPLPVIIFVVAVLPAVCEEVFFRGFILRGLRKNISCGEPFASMIAVGLCGFMFAVIHMDPVRFLSVLCSGITISYVGYITGSLVLPSIMHFFNNFAAVVPVWFLLGSFVFDSAPKEINAGFSSVAHGLPDMQGLFRFSPVAFLSFATYSFTVGAAFMFGGFYLIKREMKRREKKQDKLLPASFM